MAQYQEFKSKVAFVTGASAGIGRATAIEFAESGAKVVVVDTNISGGQEVVAHIKKLGGEAYFVSCDVSNAESVQRAVGETIAKYGALHFAFNNAGIEGAQALTADCTIENWDRVIGTNLRGVWLCMKYQIPQMLKQGGGSIVNCASVAGLIGFRNIAAYTASKHGIVGLTKTAALEYAKLNIRINAVCPGVIATSMIDRFTGGNAQVAQALAAGEPVGRMGRPEEVASAVTWLSSAGSSFVTGQAVGVDGGWLAQ